MISLQSSVAQLFLCTTLPRPGFLSHLHKITAGVPAIMPIFEMGEGQRLLAESDPL